MNISIKAVALAAALSTISFAAPVAAQEPLREGEVREEPCRSIRGFGYGSEVVQGVRVQDQNGNWFIGPKVLTFRFCQRPQTQNLVSLPDIRTIRSGPQRSALRACSDGFIVTITRDDVRDVINSPCVSL